MLIPELEAVLALAPEEALARLSTIPEGQWFERKSARATPREVAVPVVAMANAEGGYVAIGFHNRQPEPMSTRRVNALRQVGVDYTEPAVRTTAAEIAVGSGSVVVLRVEPGRRVHATAGGECYLRIGDESRKLGYAARQQLEYERGVDVFEALPVDRPDSSLDQAALAEYRQLIGSSSVEGMLAARDLLTADGRPTVAAWLLFADRPQAVFPEAHVRVLRYANTFRGVGADLQLLDDGDVRLEGPLPSQIGQAEEVIDKWLPKRRALTPNGRFGPVPLIPRDAWREGLVNAVIHRSYAWAGDHIRVEIFPDRLEITSPGGLPGIGDPANPLQIRRYARNPRIARVTAEMGIAQELGEGIQRMFTIMRDAGMNDPVYSAGPNQVRVTLYASARNTELDALAPTAATIVHILRRADSPLGTSQIAQLAQVTSQTALRHLKQLQTAGVVIRRGTSARDPRATWTLA
ncbi:MAG: putative DNA binding domain-containing protein [Bifidobacteriaceae bacterium]|nr:putative DNA binding domain-containing protein [Bifidobacteriaceae bacterium]